MPQGGHPPHHSITSSASRRNGSEIVSPSAFAVLRLTIRSNLVGCSTGRSAGRVHLVHVAGSASKTPFFKPEGVMLGRKEGELCDQNPPPCLRCCSPGPGSPRWMPLCCLAWRVGPSGAGWRESSPRDRGQSA